MKEEDIKELYEKYEDEFVRTEEYQKLAEKLNKKYDEMKEKFTSEQLEDVDEFEETLTLLLGIENKEAFKKGLEEGIKAAEK